MNIWVRSDKSLEYGEEMAPKNTIDPPAAKKNSKGNLVTDKAELEELYLNTYIERLKPNPVREDLQDIFELKDMLFDMRIEEFRLKVTRDQGGTK